MSASNPIPTPTDLDALREAVRCGAGSRLYSDVLADDGDVTSFIFKDDEALIGLGLSLGHTFSHVWLLRAALIHKSFSAESYRSRSSEQLAWLGDSVLQHTVTTGLLARYLDAPVGDLSQARSTLVSRASCEKAARKLGLDKLLVTGMSFQSDVSQAMCVEVFKSVLGAIACDAGIDAAANAFWRVMGGLPETVGEMVGGFRVAANAFD